MQSTPVPHCRVIVAITGSVAAYKSVELVRQLRRHGVDVRVIMTEGAKAFITPLTLQAVCGHPVRNTLFDPAAEAGMDHIELARWADYLCIAPASANCISKLSQGIADDLLTTVCLATRAQLVLAPAMNQYMWQHPAIQQHISQLQQLGVLWLSPEQGEQACGDIGQGRMCEPTTIAATLLEDWQTRQQPVTHQQPLRDKRVLITAGPTREAIDPVRYLTNYSSGKMGYALASAAANAGANVTLISGPTQLDTPPNVLRIDVTSAQEMYRAALAHCDQHDIFIATAAVANYRTQTYHSQKQHWQTEQIHLPLVRNSDILATVAKRDHAPFCVGFAAQTHDVITYAKQKLIDKGVALIIANQVGGTQGGFSSDDNQVTVLSKHEEVSLPRMPKIQLAKLLIDMINQHYSATVEHIITEE